MQSKNEIKICEQLYPDLSIRGGAKIFFDYIKTMPNDNIIINFEGSSFMGRSFAQEYLKQKKQINKNIEEIKLPKQVRSMLNLVENSPTPNIKKLLEEL